MVNRQGCTLPGKTWEESVASFKRTGQWTDVTTGHASNADVVVMKPGKNGDGLYALCVGTARRGLAPCMPTWCSPIYNETNTFWELKLASSPAGVMDYARQKAEKDIENACKLLEALPQNANRQGLEGLAAQAQAEYSNGRVVEGLSDRAQALPVWAKATRSYTRAQVRAMQVVDAIEPPPTRPEDFGV